MITYELCDPKEQGVRCKSESEIQEALEFSYILVLENNEEYHPEEFPGSDE